MYKRTLSLISICMFENMLFTYFSGRAGWYFLIDDFDMCNQIQ